MTSKSVIIHLGYHKTGSSSLQKWLLDHAEILRPHLLVFNLADGTSNPLKFATQKFAMGAGTEGGIAQECRRIRDVIRAAPQSRVCITDEGLLGQPLGFAAGDFQETGIYPHGAEIVSILAHEFAEFSPTFIIFERAKDPWLRSVHNQMFKQNCVTEGFDDFIARLRPDLSWSRLRGALEDSVGQHGRLVTNNFEAEFAKVSVAEMSVFKLLDLPPEVLGRCRPKLERINPSLPLPIKPAIQIAPKPVIVLGGANSMVVDGWVNLLRREFTALVDVTNLSVGACTSAMALYRFLSFEDRPDRAPVIWEYGINEFNHLQGGQSLDSLLYHVEWLIQLCIREERPFLPVLMRNQAQAGPHQDPYMTAIQDLFAIYELEVLDCNRLLQVVARGAPNLGQWYSDGSHYDTGSAFPARVAEQVAYRLDTLRAPVQHPDRATHFDRLALAFAMPEATARFENSVLASDFASFSDAPQITIFGRPLAAFIVTSGSGPKITFDFGDALFGPISTQVDYGAAMPPRQLRQLVFSDAFATRSDTTAGVVQVTIDQSDATPLVQNMFCWKDTSEETYANGLVAILFETTHHAVLRYTT